MTAAQRFKNVLEVTPAGGDKSDHHKPYLAPCPDRPGYTRLIVKQELPKDLIIKMLIQIIEDIDSRHPPDGEQIDVYTPRFRLYTQKEAAVLLGCQPSTIRKWRLEGKLAYKPGRPVLILENDLFDYFNSNKKYTQRLSKLEPEQREARKPPTGEELYARLMRRRRAKALEKQRQTEREQGIEEAPVYNHRFTKEEKAQMRAAERARVLNNLKLRNERGQLTDAEYNRRVQFEKRQELAEKRQAKAAEPEVGDASALKRQPKRS